MSRARPAGEIPGSISEPSAPQVNDPPRCPARPLDAKLLQALLDASGEAVVLCDADDRVIMANPAAGRIVPDLAPGVLIAFGAAAALFDPGCAPGQSRRVAYGDRLIRVRRETFGLAREAWYLSDVTAESSDGNRSASPANRRTEFLIKAGHRLSGSLDARRCAATVAELAASFLADAATVMLPPDHRRSHWMRATAGDPAVEEGGVPSATAAELPGLTEALYGDPATPSRRVDAAQAPDWLLPTGFGPASHLLMTPLPGTGAPAGVLVLARRQGAPPFDEDTEILVQDFAVRAGAAIAAAMLYQEQSATNAILTEDLLPPRLPVLDQADLAGSLRASQQAGLIGGDFYDVCLPDVPAGTGARRAAPLVILGDVCGKGARAAVLAGQIRHGLRTLLLLESRPERLIELINRTLLASSAPDSYVTLVLARLRPGREGSLLVDLAVAGHPEPLILRQDGGIEEVTAQGSMLGVLERIDLNPVTVELAPGELCLLYSDGITEAPGGPTGRELYGTDRLKAALTTCARMPATAVVRRLEQTTTAWAPHGEKDDRALLAIRARPLPHRRP
ncbi:SpoIIE family protein phosphatase [Sphaerisporangium dianthi]|uniref:SpoIIE family protein phosphatase n=1 Tax=Sphaerisporangium dianthi TaxID=1436120 RepID=A0ABV9CL46_9ACTN